MCITKRSILSHGKQVKRTFKETELLQRAFKLMILSKGAAVWFLKHRTSFKQVQQE